MNNPVLFGCGCRVYVSHIEHCALHGAAPALLEALELVGAAIHDHKTEPVVWIDSATIAGLVRIIRAAITQAKGESNG